MRARGRSTNPAVVWLVLAVFGAVLVAEAVGWALAAARNPFAPADLVPALVYNAGQLLSVLAPLLWGAATIWLVPALGGRVSWLATGAVVLLPWPLVLGSG